MSAPRRQDPLDEMAEEADSSWRYCWGARPSRWASCSVT